LPLAACFIFLLCFNLNGQVPPLPNTSPNLAKPTEYDKLPLNLRLQLQSPSYDQIVFYSLEDLYTDITNSNIPAISGVPISDPLHDHVANALKEMGFNSYVRHFQTHGFKRFPMCYNGEEYYNLTFENSTQPGTCLQIPDGQNAPWINRILDDGHELNMRTGFYIKGMADFFFQMEYKTGDPFGGANLFSTCICKNFQTVDFDNNAILDQTLPLYQITNGIPAPSILDQLSAYPAFPETNPEDAVYYLCVNCPDWRDRLSARLEAMRQEGTDYVCFDVDHMPSDGCFCRNCRTKYANEL
jgi:hypothetical protein